MTYFSDVSEKSNIIFIYLCITYERPLVDQSLFGKFRQAGEGVRPTTPSKLFSFSGILRKNMLDTDTVREKNTASARIACVNT